MWTTFVGTGFGNPPADTNCLGFDQYEAAQAVDEAGNTAVAGCIGNGAGGSPVVFKFAPDGSLLWKSALYGSEPLLAILGMVTDAAGDVLVTGAGFANGQRDLIALRYDGSNGAVRWSQRIDLDGAEDIGFDLALDDQGDVIVAGFGTRSGGNRDLLLAKLDGANGAMLWTVTLDGPGNGSDSATVVSTDAQGDIYAAGFLAETEGRRMLTAKFSGDSGTLLWQATAAPAVDDLQSQATALAVTSGGDPIVAGSSIGNDQNEDYLLLRYDQGSGIPVWRVQAPGPEGDPPSGPHLALGADGNPVMGGSSGPRDNTDFWVGKFAIANGAPLWSEAVDGPQSGDDVAIAVVVDNQGDVLVTGESALGADEPSTLSAKLGGVSGQLLWTAWQANNEGEARHVRSLAVDQAGDPVTLARRTVEGGGPDLAVEKLDGATGALQWTASEGMTLLASTLGCERPLRAANVLAIDAEGSSLVVGCQFNGLNNQVMLAKIAPDGELRWQSLLPEQTGSPAVAVAIDSQGEVILALESFDPVTRWDVQILKYAGADGNLRWSARYTGPTVGSEQSLGAVTVDANDDVIVAGMTSTAGMGFSLATVKLAGGNGATLWTKLINMLSGTVRAVRTDGNGDVLLAGSLDNQLALAKLDGATGNELWVTRSGDFLGLTGGEANMVALDAVGDVTLAGVIGRPGTGFDLVTTRHDGIDGSLRWAAFHAGPGEGYETATAVALDFNGNAIVAGQQSDIDGTTDPITLKYDAGDGSLLWQRILQGPVNGEAGDVVVTASGDAILTARTPSDCQRFQLTTIRYGGANGEPLWITSGFLMGGTVAAIELAADGSLRVAATALLDQARRMGVVRIDEMGVVDRILRDGFEEIGAIPVACND